MHENYIFFILQCVMLRCSSDKSVGSGGNLTEFAVGVHKVFFGGSMTLYPAPGDLTRPCHTEFNFLL